MLTSLWLIPKLEAPEELRAEASRLRLFCFAWTPFRPGDEAVLSEVTKQFARCDGHAFFSARVGRSWL